MNLNHIDITVINFEKKPAFELTRNTDILNIFNLYFTNKQKLTPNKSSMSNHNLSTNIFNKTHLNQQKNNH